MSKASESQEGVSTTHHDTELDAAKRPESSAWVEQAPNQTVESLSAKTLGGPVGLQSISRNSRTSEVTSGRVSVKVVGIVSKVIPVDAGRSVCRESGTMMSGGAGERAETRLARGVRARAPDAGHAEWRCGTVWVANGTGSRETREDTVVGEGVGSHRIGRVGRMRSRSPACIAGTRVGGRRGLVRAEQGWEEGDGDGLVNDTCTGAVKLKITADDIAQLGLDVHTG